ncbi:hypothetical protein [Burkholderia cepacia]|uniref:hypothetical protein n=1 Tax=Burkholderia cepacia TaxID=292 RepID=UPI001F1AD850|nr:hypothetical protein [Burkholderia cepacia]MCE4125745.1 hypothetical protein [Burkholderia cepacia]
MAITPVSSGFSGAVGATSTSGSPGSFALPSTWAAGQFALLAVQAFTDTTANYGNTVTVPSGWTNIYNAGSFCVCYRFLQAGDTGPSIVTSSGVGWGAMITTFTGVDTTNPIDAKGFCCTRNGLSTNTMAPPINPGYSDDYLVFAWGGSGGTSAVSPPSGMTGIGSIANLNTEAAVRFAGVQLASGARVGSAYQTPMTTANVAPFNNTTSGLIALKTSGSTHAVTRPNTNPYLASALNGTIGNSITAGAMISARFEEIAAPGDVLMAFFDSTGAGAVTPPDSSWKKIGVDLAPGSVPAGFYWFVRTSVAGDPQTFSFTNSGSTDTINVNTATVKMMPGGTSGTVGLDNITWTSQVATGTNGPVVAAQSFSGAAADELLLTRQAQASSTSVTFSGSSGWVAVTKTISPNPNSTLGVDYSPTNPTPASSPTKASAGSGNELNAIITFRVVPPSTKQSQQMMLS